MKDQLYERVVARIHLAEKRQDTLRLYSFFSLSIFSGAGLIAAAIWFYTDLTQSGFLQIISLLFSDAGTVAVYWHDFLSSLLDFLPATSLAVCLGSVAVFLLSLSYLSKYLRDYGEQTVMAKATF